MEKLKEKIKQLERSLAEEKHAKHELHKVLLYVEERRGGEKRGEGRGKEERKLKRMRESGEELWRKEP